jgi:hypothetical protein
MNSFLGLFLRRRDLVPNILYRINFLGGLQIVSLYIYEVLGLFFNFKIVFTKNFFKIRSVWDFFEDQDFVVCTADHVKKTVFCGANCSSFVLEHYPSTPLQTLNSIV